MFSTYFYSFRLVLLSISMFCTLSSLVTILLVYNYRRVKVFKYSSPTFLSITLLGCAVMYTEVVSFSAFHLIIRITFSDGCDLPDPEHLVLRPDQVDQAPGLLHHLHRPANENLEVNYYHIITLRIRSII